MKTTEKADIAKSFFFFFFLTLIRRFFRHINIEVDYKSYLFFYNYASLDVTYGFTSGENHGLCLEEWHVINEEKITIFDSKQT